MAGPGIRAWHLADELSKYFPTTLAGRIEDLGRLRAGFEVESNGTRASRSALDEASVIIGQPTRELLARRGSGRRLVFDLFDPVVLELRELYREPTVRQRIHYRLEWSRLRMALESGDLLISASAEQRAFYAGVYASGTRAGGWLRKWVDVPFGLPAEPPGEERAPIAADGPVLAWGGGLWEWLDPDLAVRAVLGANERGTACRLLFLGTRRPNRDLSEVGTLSRIEKAAREAGDRVIWNPEWVPYLERSRWLRASTAAVMLHRRTLEGVFSIRTRFFDALWCSLPVIATDGGYAAGVVEREALGVVVPPDDVEACTDAIVRLVGDDGFRARSVMNVERVRPRYTWSEIVGPLVEALQRWQ